jgi:methionine-rich copper-binding protein CopC
MFFMHVLRSTIFTLPLLSLLAIPALAHSALDHASPATGGKVRKSPPRVELWFTEEIEPAFSSLAVFDSSGREVDKRDTTASSNKKLLFVSIPPLSSGRYKVVWRVVSVDKHKTEGSFPFVVLP